MINEEMNIPIFPIVTDSFADSATAQAAVVDDNPLIRIAIPKKDVK